MLGPKKLIAATATLYLLAIFAAGSQEQPPQAPDIPTQQEPNRALESQQQPGAQINDAAKAPTDAPKVVTPASDKEGHRDDQQGNEEGTEFWPSFFGYRLKITDTLLALFTFALFVATWFLWRATVGLVRGAEKTAERQLRAYVHIVDATIIHANDEWSPNIRIKLQNYGQTPAYRVAHKSKVNVTFVLETPPKIDEIPEEVDYFSDLGPTQDHIRTIVIHRSPWQFMKAAIEKNAGTCYVTGEVTYQDVFGNTHSTRYRFEVKADDEGVSDGGLFFSPEGNESN